MSISAFHIDPVGFSPELFDTLDPNHTYDCTGSSDIEQRVVTIAKHHFPSLDSIHSIQYGVLSAGPKLRINYIPKSKKYAVLSIVCCIQKSDSPLVFTEIDLDVYKYKDFPRSNKVWVYFPDTGHHVVFDGSKHYGVYGSTNTKYLRIVVYPGEQTRPELEPLNLSVLPVSLPSSEQEHEVHIYDPDVMEHLVYGTKPVVQLSHYTNTTRVHFIQKEGFDYKKMVSQHGDMINDILSIIDSKETVTESNRFYRNKILQNILPREVCYWILNECFKPIEWKLCPHANYEYYVNLESFPHILNYMLFMSHFWIEEIRKQYSIPSSLNLNIKEIFVAKYTTNKVIYTKHADGGLFCMNIQLNLPSDFTEGSVLFDDGYTIDLQQGDCLLYNGKRLRTPGYVTDGEKYVLVTMVDIVLNE
jgi:hypothetical protein